MVARPWLLPEYLFVYSKAMCALYRLISRCLLLVMLATVFSPSFGWEAVQGMAEHEHVAIAEESDHHAAHIKSDREAGMDDQADASCCTDSQHHCCLGHQLGHPQGNTVSLLLAASPAVMAMVLSEPFLTRVPEGLERPPRFVAV